MKLRQTEYCHNCDRHVEFEFDDVEGKQLIVCPECNHQHFREIDAEIITRIRIGIKCYGPELRIYEAEIHPTTAMCSANETPLYQPLKTQYKTYKVIGIDEDGRAIIEGKEKRKLKVTDRRWGRDPSQ